MKNKYIFFTGLLFYSVQLFAQTEYTINLYDSQRKRIVPAAVYEPKHVTRNTLDGIKHGDIYNEED